MVFTEESMEAAVWAWGWLLAARPDLTVLVHTKLTDAWCWTVEQRMGLFSGMVPPPIALRAVSHTVIQTRSGLPLR